MWSAPDFDAARGRDGRETLDGKTFDEIKREAA
jgi:hypothetical protein